MVCVIELSFIPNSMATCSPLLKLTFSVQHRECLMVPNISPAISTLSCYFQCNFSSEIANMSWQMYAVILYLQLSKWTLVRLCTCTKRIVEVELQDFFKNRIWGLQALQSNPIL